MTIPREALLAGRMVGEFHLQALIGAGAMGEVYRAHDSKLGRDVAVKVLPSRFADDPDRLARFTREAQLLAALNHPNIATIHGLEDSDGVPALVMELVQGPTLADRLADRSGRSAPLPLQESLRIARQIIDALEAAHDRGIVHRDLKPANLKFSQDGQVKVLDFGLAKAFSTEPMFDGAQLPTITIGATRAGTVVGTPAYMSPEQARGQAVDKTADIWAFGCVLFEMLAGRRAFPGETMSDTLAAVLERQPDWGALPVATPPGVRWVLRRCLDKNPRQRWRDVGDIRIALEENATAGLFSDPETPGASRGPERIAWAALALAAAVSGAFMTPMFRRAPPPTEIRFEALFPRDMPSDFAQLALSPDGRQIAVASSFVSKIPLWLRPLDSTSGRTLPGTDGGSFPFWSPDGGSLGFFADGKLKRMDLASEAITVIADTPNARGGAWQDDGMILFAPNASGPLFRVSATGGQPVAVTHLLEGQNDHRAPSILPDRQHVLYYSRGTPQVRGVYVARLDGSDSRRLLEADAAAVYSPSGHLLFPRDGVLLAQPFDAGKRTLSGAAFRLADRVAVNPGISMASISASSAGAIAYSGGSIRPSQLTWFDRAGQPLQTIGPADLTAVANIGMSPDGRQVALSRVVAGNWDIWLTDMQGVASRFTSGRELDFNPVWLPDGKRIVFQSNNDFRIRSVNDGAAEQVVLKAGREMQYPSDVSPDGRQLLYTRSTTTATGSSVGLWSLQLAGDPMPRPFAASAFDERDGQFSPDGRAVAYQSNESGRYEVYLQPFPGPGERVKVSAGGGQQVRWGQRSGELFYIASDQRLTSVPVTIGANGSIATGQPAPLFRIVFDNGGFQARQQYVVSPDGQRFLINNPTGPVDPSSISVVLNWAGKP